MPMINARLARNDAIWSFETPRFFVGFYALEEDLDPADAFEVVEDITAVRDGLFEWFCANIRVYHVTDGDNWTLLGQDYLGACAYTTARSFAEGDNRGGYFRDMVREAIGNARAEIRRMGDLAATMRSA